MQRVTGFDTVMPLLQAGKAISAGSRTGSREASRLVWRIDRETSAMVLRMVVAQCQNPNDFLLPDLGEGLEEAELIEWCVKIGDRVQENQTAREDGDGQGAGGSAQPAEPASIAALHGKPGQAIKVGTPLVTYREEQPAASDRDWRRQREAMDASRDDRAADAGTVVGNARSGTGSRGEGAVRPRRRCAGSPGRWAWTWSRSTGTGIGGRITAADVEAGRGGRRSRRASPLAATAAAAPREAARPALPQPAPATDTERIPFRGVRRTIAEHLRYSVDRAIHFTVMDEADVSALDELRRRLVAASNEKITLLPFVAAAVCRVLIGRRGQQFRRLNSTVDDDRQEIVQHRAVHLGIATDTDSGLMVPVIRDAQSDGRAGNQPADRGAGEGGPRPLDPAPSADRLDLHDQQLRRAGRPLRHADHQLSRGGNSRRRPGP